MIHFDSLKDVSDKDILDCFNLSFSDYSIPLQLSLAQFETKLRNENINKGISIGAFNERRLVGFVLHGDRANGGHRMAYNAGTGVVPGERGQRLTRRMYDFIVPSLIENKFSEVVLEVISDNLPAIKSYESIGFDRTRSLICLKGEPRIEEINKGVRIEKVNEVNLDVLDGMGDIVPTWQNSRQTISNMADDILFCLAYVDEEICGYCVLNYRNNRVLQIAVKERMQNRLVGSTILQSVKSTISSPISIINIDSGARDTLSFFKKRNLHEFLTQYEMRLRLSCS